MELGPDLPGDLGDPALDGGVDVLVPGLENERPVGQLPKRSLEAVGDKRPGWCGFRPPAQPGVGPPSGATPLGTEAIEAFAL